MASAGRNEIADADELFLLKKSVQPTLRLSSAGC